MPLNKNIVFFFGMFFYPVLTLASQVTVAKGDTIYSLLRKQGVLANLAVYSRCTRLLNNLSDENSLIIGQKLTMPSVNDRRCSSSGMKNQNRPPLIVGKYRVKNMRLDDSAVSDAGKKREGNGLVELNCTYKLPSNISDRIDLEGFSCGFSKSPNRLNSAKVHQYPEEHTNTSSYTLSKQKTLYHNLLNWMEKKQGKLKWSSEFDSLIESDVRFDNDFGASIRELSSYFSQYKFTFYEKNNVLEVIDN